ncbi:MAG TPA: Stp1/IreP family PP2C-type Ser/Thr phosphatase [Chthonomonadaceae bacterium]|nr:Stp1/IreP family PP2C-type Ser/Thr phosphatase [Chthonomonadaceae bacterium]
MSDINANSSTPVSGGSPSEQETTAKFQRSELVRGWREYEARMPRVVPLLKFAAKTDMGQVRENNEDKFDFYEPEVPAILAARGSLFAVGDGIGGALAGQIASEMMLKNLISVYYNHPAPDVETALRDAIVDSNDKVYQLAQMIPERAGMGSTLTAAVFIEDRIVIAQVGDSRAYLIRDNMARQITRDHSWVEEQVRAGVLSRYEAESSPFRNLITRSIGAAPTIEPDFYQDQARVGDIWVLCSDGLTGHVHDEEIARIATRHSPSEAARQLVELANANGGRDNITVIVLSIRDLISLSAPASAQQAASEGGAAVINTVPQPPSGNALVMEPGTPPLAAAAAGDYIAPNPNLAAGDPRPRAGWRKLFGR